jgi:hypothetical protein
VAPVGRANTVSYERAGIKEWYANGPLGLEQGFTVDHRVDGRGALTLVVGRTPADVRASVAPGGTGLLLQRPTSRLRYSDLTVTDARGHRLVARIAVAGDRILLRVQDARARYPLQIDPTVEAFDAGASLTVSGQSSQSAPGAVAVSEDGRTVVVGAPTDVPYNASWYGTGGGVAYVFTESPTAGWQDTAQAAELVASDVVDSDNFGTSVAISGDGRTIVVGSPYHGSEAGAAYVFSEPTSGGWVDATQTAELTASDGAATAGYQEPGDELGDSVAISGDGSSIVAGAPYHSSHAGAAYVFNQPASGGWRDETQTAELSSSDAVTSNQLGSGSQVGGSVAISDDGGTIVADISQRDVGGTTASGGADVFIEPPNGGWQNATQTAELTRSDDTGAGRR